MTTEKTISLTWRDENYGPISGSLAFRCYDIEPYPSDAAMKKVQSAYKAAGFSFNGSRASWIAEENTDEAPGKLVSALEGLGYEVKHAGRTPEEFIEAVPSPTTTPGPRM